MSDERPGNPGEHEHEHEHEDEDEDEPDSTGLPLVTVAGGLRLPQIGVRFGE